MKKDDRLSSFELEFRPGWEAIHMFVVIVLLLGLAGVAALWGSAWLILYGLRGAFLPQSVHGLFRAVLGSLLMWAPEHLLCTTGRSLLSLSWKSAKEYRHVFEALRND